MAHAYGLTRRAGAALHHQLYSILHSGITSGRYRDGMLLPGEDALAEIYQVSRATVRRALQTLEDKRMVIRQPGVGTRVVAPIMPAPGGVGIMDLIGPYGTNGELKLLEFGPVSASPEIAQLLEVPAGTEVLQVVRMRKDGDIPLRLTRHYLPQSIGEMLTPAMLENRLVADILGKRGYAIGRTRSLISAILADATDAPLLEVDVGAPLLELSRVLRDPAGTVLLVQQSITPPDRMKLSVDVEAGAPARAAGGPH